MNGYLTTHVLDTANGCPGEGIELTLFKVEEGQLIEVVSAVTNDDGRVDSPILPKGSVSKGSMSCTSWRVITLDVAALSSLSLLFWIRLLSVSVLLTKRRTTMYRF